MRHFNETVLRGPDLEGGTGNDENALNTGGTDGGDITDGSNAAGDGETGEGTEKTPLTVREQIKASIAETSDPQQKPRDKKTGRFGDRPSKVEAAPVPAPDPAAAPAAPVIAAPEALSKEAKAEWEKTPPAIQAAFIKREQDMAKGVDELKQRYSLIDQAIAPHNDALRAMNATPQEAVHRMFLWFKALSGSPQQSFPQLAQSMGVDWNKLVAATTQGAPAAGAVAPDPNAAPAVPSNGQAAAPEIPEQVRQYVGTLEKQVKDLGAVVQQIYGGFTGIQQNMQTQNMQRVQENLSIWSKEKPYFEEVRQDMAKMIESGMVPLKDGQVDLDTAYERAIHFNPDVRAKVAAAQQQANQTAQQQSKDAATAAQQTQVSKARKASVSLPATSGPGAGNGALAAPKRKPGEFSSVRDSLKASIAQLRDQ